MRSSRYKRIYLIGIFAFSVFIYFIPNAYALDDIKTFPEKNVGENKVWTITFNDELDKSTIEDSILVQDESGDKIGVKIALLTDKESLEIRPPKEGYKLGEDYTLTINDGLRAINGVKLKQKGKIKFHIINEESNNEENNKNYLAECEVNVSPVISILKSITIKSTNNKNIKKYKVENSNTLIDVGNSAITIIDKENTNIYFYGIDGKLLIGMGRLNVSSSSKNVSIRIE
ncbi:Ig-like domain-containing protein [Clostridium rectalis]|uniref:Ig-like domain-containing protein n=1 Tax=Clostridium rectalis TaxID=2040295 RepID=UPI000F63196C|nr:Ig-like domain-containing protein [Clostridium rectalis]